ncbi:hypothetical protein ACFQZE_05155 [Paenibacillus sp. GCM10027627]|uniref:hypothetical protein n=1 Tax=unclassified Paenibacillus TaxID=185978 RepID=UPI0036402688
MMMTSPSYVYPLQPTILRPTCFTVKRIEVFVLPTTGDAMPKGYLLYLRLTSSTGTGWSEMFVNESDKPLDWTRWSVKLLRFAGRRIDFDSQEREEQQNNEYESDLSLQMFFQAANQIGLTTSPSFGKVYPLNATLLLDRAVSYASLF